MEMLFTTQEEEKRYRASGMWGDLTIYERFNLQAQKVPNKLAIIDGEREYTYGELARLVHNLSANFLNWGVKTGEVVAVQVPNCAELPLIHFALNRIGALCMPIHDSWREAEVAHLLKQGRAVAAVVPLSYKDFDCPAMFAAIGKDLADFREIFSIGGAGPHSKAFETMLENREIDPEVLRSRQPSPNDPGALMLSSGTTAMPKISVFSSNNINALLLAFARAVELTAEDIAAALAPTGTGAIGYCYPILTPLVNGGTTVLCERWDPADAVKLILKHRCTYATGVPTQLTQMLPALEEHSPEEFEGFRAFNNAGAPLPLEVGRQIEKRMGCKVLGLYGATDGGTLSSANMNDSQAKRLGTVGRPFECRDVKLVDANGEPVEPGEPGEIYYHTADKSYGYMNDEEATKATFTAKGYYRSGDLGKFDEDGYLQIVGRVKDMILRGGRNISPRLIEELVIEHPAILEVSVAAMPDPVLGERACAFAVLHKDCQLTFEEIIDFLKGRGVSTWQLPERLEVMTDLPRSAGGKIAKNELTKYITQKLNEETKESIA